ncbi:MAG: type II toxin-antitoxin system death-on-curing family toxin [Planctomycetota bacterium]
MDEPRWIRREIVAIIHAQQLAEHGGSDGIRDPGMLDSALSRPLNLWAYSQPKPDLAALAASLAHGIAKNHPFVDGNKRTAWVLCRTLLLVNGVDIKAAQEEKYQAMYSLAAGELSEDAFAKWLREHLSTGD